MNLWGSLRCLPVIKKKFGFCMSKSPWLKIWTKFKDCTKGCYLLSWTPQHLHSLWHEWRRFSAVRPAFMVLLWLICCCVCFAVCVSTRGICSENFSLEWFQLKNPMIFLFSRCACFLILLLKQHPIKSAAKRKKNLTASLAALLEHKHACLIPL